MTDDDRTTQPPPPPPENWRQELVSALADVQDEAGELMHLFGRMYARAAGLGTALARLGNAIRQVPPS